MAENRENQFTREDITTLLGEVAAEYTVRNGSPLKVLIYGGAAATLRHKFRTSTHDIDHALLEESPLFEDCVEIVGKKYGMFPRWMHRLERFTSAPCFRENFYRHSDALHPGTESDNLSFLVQDSDWQLANKLYWFRRDRKNDGLDIVGILQERGGDAQKQVSRIVQDMFDESSVCCSDGTILLAALERGENLDELAARLDKRASYYEKVYDILFSVLSLKDVSAACKICWEESLFWQTKEDVQTSLARHGINLAPIIVNHIARIMFKPEFWML